jgi:hypothetical protein
VVGESKQTLHQQRALLPRCLDRVLQAVRDGGAQGGQALVC